MQVGLRRKRNPGDRGQRDSLEADRARRRQRRDEFGNPANQNARLPLYLRIGRVEPEYCECFEGKISYLTSEAPPSGYPAYPNGTPDQMMWGCVGWWYSGHWYDSGALNYISEVQGYLATQMWRQSGGVGD